MVSCSPIYWFMQLIFTNWIFVLSFSVSLLLHPVLQPCCRGDGDSRLEVHGGVPSSPGGRSIPLPGFSPVSFPRTPTQAPQTILTASQRGVYTHLYTHTHKYTKTHRHPRPQTQRDNLSPCCYLLHYLQPPPDPHLLPHPEPAVFSLF